jgi:hypothetical protein
MAFIDAHSLRRAICRAARLSPHDQRVDVEAVRDWLTAGADGVTPPHACRRILYYDGAFDLGHPAADGQQRFLHAIGRIDLIQPRLGHLSEVTPDWHEELRATLAKLNVPIEGFEAHMPLLPSLRQKGVDILLAVDLVRLAERGAIGHALILAADSDFAPAVEIARNAGVLITLLSPVGTRPAMRLCALADETVEIPRDVATTLLRDRSPRPPVAVRSETSSEAIPAPEPAWRRTRRGTRAGRLDRPALRAVTGEPAPPAALPGTAPTPSHPTPPSTDIAAAPVAAGEPPVAVALPAPPVVRSRESFSEDERAGFKFSGPDGSGRIYLTALNDTGEFAVRVERDEQRLTAGTVNPLDQVPTITAEPQSCQ